MYVLYMYACINEHIYTVCVKIIGAVSICHYFQTAPNILRHAVYVIAFLFPTPSQYVIKYFQTKRFISNVNVTGTCATTPRHTHLFIERE